MNSSKEISFDKYANKGAYHWKEISGNPLLRNAFVMGRYHNIFLALEKALGKDLSGRKILDIGCGDGVLTFWLAQKGAAAKGIDTSALAIQLAQGKKETAGIEFVEGSAYDLPWQDGEFDAVVSSDVIEHVRDPGQFLSEANRVLKIGGVAVISTPIRLHEEFCKEHVVEWYEGEYQKVIEEYFPNSNFYRSHPVFWKELYERSRSMKGLINILSLVWNPFYGFQSPFKMFALQHSASIKES